MIEFVIESVIIYIIPHNIYDIDNNISDYQFDLREAGSIVVVPKRKHWISINLQGNRLGEPKPWLLEKWAWTK